MSEELNGWCKHLDMEITSRKGYIGNTTIWTVNCPDCEFEYGFVRDLEEAEKVKIETKPRPLSLTADEVFDMLAARNVSKVICQYEGGNDSGGVQKTTVYGKNFEELDSNVVFPDGYLDYSARFRNYAAQISREPTQDDLDMVRLEMAIELPVHQKYGSWAGDFEAYGTITWDVENRTAEMEDHYGETTFQDSTITITD